MAAAVAVADMAVAVVDMTVAAVVADRRVVVAVAGAGAVAVAVAVGAAVAVVGQNLPKDCHHQTTQVQQAH